MLVCPSDLPPSFGDAAHNPSCFEYEMKTMRRRNDSLLLGMVEEKEVPVLPDEIIQSIGWAVRTRCALQDEDSSGVVTKGYKAEDLLNMMLVCKSWYNTLSPILYRDITTARPHLLVQSCSSLPACASIRSKSRLLASCRRLHLKPPASFRLSNGNSGSYNEHIFRRNVDSISDQLSCVTAEGGLSQALPNVESVSYGAKSPDPDHGQASLKAIEDQAVLIKKILGTKEVLRKKYTDLEKQWIGVLQSIQAPIQCHSINASTTYNRPPAVQVVPTDETSQRTHERIFHFDLPSVSERWPIVLGARAVYACPAINSNVLYSGLEDFLHVIDFIIAKGREMVTDVAKHRSAAQRQDGLGLDVCFQIPQSIVDPLAELIANLDESPHELAIYRALREIKKYSDENQETAETIGLDRWDIQIVDDLDTCEACNRAFGATEPDVLDWTLGRLWPQDGI